jgi:hypothetical protein
MSSDLFASLGRATLLYGVWYGLAGWLIFGLYTLTKNVPRGQERAVFTSVMLVWPFALTWLCLVTLWRLVGLAAHATSVLFNPDHGPIARLLGAGAMWSRHWSARLAGRDPYMLRLAEWEREHAAPRSGAKEAA